MFVNNRERIGAMYQNRNVFILIGLLAFAYFLVKDYEARHAPKQVSYSDMVKMVARNEVKSVNIANQKIEGVEQKGGRFEAVLPPQDDLKSFNELLLAHNVTIVYQIPSDSNWSAWLMMLAIFFVVMVIVRQRQQSSPLGNGGIFGFMNNKAKEVTPQSTDVSFNDVAGIDEAKMELQEVVEYLKNPKKFSRLGARVSKGVLLVGLPGTGKTLLARAVAGEASVPFFQISGSDFIEVFVGVGASRVRSLFEEARRKSPCIVFIDEIDSVGRRRSTSHSINHSESEQTLNQLLASMDGFANTTGVVVIGATNRPEILDEALLRPGRFDRHVTVQLPDVVGREAILRIHAAKVLLDPRIDFSVIARKTSGFSGSSLANLLNEAAIIATRRDRVAVTQADLEEAFDRILEGAARPNMKINMDDKKRVAYHELGHALAAMAMPVADPVRKITIIPRGQALGLTSQQGEEDRYIRSMEYLNTILTVYMGGRVAEKLIYKDWSTGAADDLVKATKLARHMVMRFGMSEKLGPLSVPAPNKPLNEDSPQVSEATLELIDEEVKRLILQAELSARTILELNVKCLQTMVEVLLQKETISGDEARALFEQYRHRDYPTG